MSKPLTKEEKRVMQCARKELDTKSYLPIEWEGKRYELYLVKSHEMLDTTEKLECYASKCNKVLNAHILIVPNYRRVPTKWLVYICRI